ncbi:MAG: exodeoxyribonuclease VII large subunit, partial [Pseudomonadota bacterium]
MPAAQRLDIWSDRLPNALRTGLHQRRLRLTQAGLRPQMLRGLLTANRDRLGLLDRRGPMALQRRVGHASRDLGSLAARLRLSLLQQDLARKTEQFTRLTRQFADLARTQQQARRDQLAALDRLRETLGYQATLARGYAVIRSGPRVITTRVEALAAPSLEIEFKDGRLTPMAKPGSPAKPRKKSVSDPPDQGSLF